MSCIEAFQESLSAGPVSNSVLPLLLVPSQEYPPYAAGLGTRSILATVWGELGLDLVSLSA